MIRPFGEFAKSVEAVARHLGQDSKLELKIRGISSSTKNIEPSDLFVAIAGAKSHGAAFIDDALSKGAVAVLTDKAGAELIKNKVPTLVVDDPRGVVGPLADWFYGNPSTKMQLVGITGTNGKTTTSYLLNQIWKSAGKSTALIGTLGIEICGENSKGSFTTPESDELARTFAIAAERHVTNCVMEVSSIAIEMGRVNGPHFKFVAFTNLTQDHLDFHGDMDAYGKAKAKLFNLSYAESALINIDNEFGKKLFTNCEIPAVSISRTNRSATWHFEKISANQFKTEVAIRGEGGILIEGEISLIGEHNLDNLLMAVAIAFHSGVDPLVIAAVLGNLRGAPGRLEVINLGQDFLAIVDYAHTPDAVTHALSTAKKLSNKVVAVLGCGGDRDPSKRPLMGSALVAGSNLAVFTSDNPRSENPNSILNQMTKSIELSDEKVVIVDRREAIAFAVANATKGDCVIVLGKGHETGQEVANQIYPFDDRIELARAIEKLA